MVLITENTDDNFQDAKDCQQNHMNKPKNGATNINNNADHNNLFFIDDPKGDEMEREREMQYTPLQRGLSDISERR